MSGVEGVGGARFWASSIRRDRRVASVLLIVVIGLAGGLVLTSVAAARRTATSLDRYLAQPSLTSHILIACPEGLSDAELNDPGVDCGKVDNVREYGPLVAKADVVDDVVGVATVVSAVRTRPQDPWSPTIQFALMDEWRGLTTAPVIVDGRLPDRMEADQTVINERLAADLGIGVGDRMDTATYGADQRFDAVSGAAVEPSGSPVHMEVVGIVRDTHDLTTDPEPQFFSSAAWWDRYGGDDVASYGKGLALRLKDPGDEAGLEDSLRAALPGRLMDVSDNLEGAETSERVIDLQALAVWGVALVSLVASLGFVSQLIGREIGQNLVQRQTLTAAGMTRRDLVLAAGIRAVPIALAGACLAAIAAVLASPVEPVGLARRVEIDPGFHVDRTVVAAGAVLIAGWVLFATLVAAVSHTRTRRAPVAPRTVPFFGNLRPPARAGLSFLGPDERRTARGAVVGTALAVAFVILALSMQSSYSSLLDHPGRVGQNWDVVLGDFGSPDEVASGRAVVDATEGVAGVGAAVSTEASIGRTPLLIFAFTEPDSVVRPTILEGRAPASSAEIALATTTLNDLHLELGDSVTITSPVTAADVGPLLIVGRTVVNDGVDSTAPPGRGGLVTREAYEQIDPATTGQSLLIAAKPGVTPRELIHRLGEGFGGSVGLASPPEDVGNLARVSAAPLVLALIVAVLAATALVGSLLSIIGRRRRDVAVLRSIGFVRRQVLGSVFTVALLLAGLAVAIGAPLGIVASRWSWRSIELRLGVESGVVVPFWALGVSVVGALGVAAAVAALPALRASRVPATVALRTE